MRKILLFFCIHEVSGVGVQCTCRAVA